MSNVGPEHRSYLPIDQPDLARLAALAERDLAHFFAQHRDWAALYQDRLLCVALTQGDARHYLDQTTGVNDFDVYTFFHAHPSRPWPPRRRVALDFGDPKFGTSQDRPDFVGRRVDCIGRSIDVPPGDDAVTAVQRYLRAGRTDTARFLAQKAVVLLTPDCGRVVWGGES